MSLMNRRHILKYLGGAGIAFQPALRVLARGAEDEKQDGIFLNQLGYQPGAAKQATVRSGGTGRPEFLVRSAATHAIAFKGQLAASFADAASGDQTSTADFSALRTPGMYQLEVAGQLSDLFPISHDVYAAGLRRTMRAFYGQRCGCPVDLGEGYKYPSCHADGAFHPSSGKSGARTNRGGWHDAGDYGRYVVNSGISTGTLLWAWELYPAALKSLSLANANDSSLPDYLAELRWNLEWMLSMQDADGGVWHKQTSEHFCGMVMPENDRLPSYMIGTGTEPYKSTGASANLAAVTAIGARCYASFDGKFAKQCLDAARRAWSWSVAHPKVVFVNPPGITTGGYGDQQCDDEISWASAELWRTTGEAQYERAFLTTVGASPSITTPSWSEVHSLACWSYTLAERQGNAAMKGKIKEATLAAAEAFEGRSTKSGFGATLALADYGWGSNGTAANQSLLLLIAHHFHAGFREPALNNLHYMVGRNCFGVSWVTQLGLRPFEHPHHRPSVADGIAAPWPGLLSGGPNAHGGDALADKMARRPPMRMWVDDDRAYSMNEIAINWNAPLVFLLAAANS